MDKQEPPKEIVPGPATEQRKDYSEKRKRGIELLKMGLTVTEVSGALNVDETAVSGWIKNECAIDESLSDLPTENIAKRRTKAIELFKMGKTIVDICREINGHHWVVVNWIKEERAINTSLPDLPAEIGAKRRAKAMELFKAGKSTAEISGELKVHVTTVRKWIRNGRAVDPSLRLHPATCFSGNMSMKRTRAMRLFKTGKSTAEISSEMNIDQSDVCTAGHIEDAVESFDQRSLATSAAEKMLKKRHKAIALFSGGKSKAQVARDLHVNTDTVGHWIESGMQGDASVSTSRKVSLISKCRSDKFAEKKKKALELHKIGMRKVEMSRILGVSTPTLKEWLDNKSDLVSEVAKKEEALELYETGMDKCAIAQALGVPETLVCRWLNGDDFSDRSTPAVSTCNDEFEKKEQKVLAIYNMVKKQAEMARNLGISPAMLGKWLDGASPSRAITFPTATIVSEEITEKKRKAFELHNAGMINAAISRALQVPESTLRGWLRKANQSGGSFPCSQIPSTEEIAADLTSEGSSLSTEDLSVYEAAGEGREEFELYDANMREPQVPEAYESVLADWLDQADLWREDFPCLAVSSTHKKSAEEKDGSIGANTECFEKMSQTNRYAVLSPHKCSPIRTLNEPTDAEVLLAGSPHNAAGTYTPVPSDYLDHEIQIIPSTSTLCSSSASSPLNTSEKPDENGQGTVALGKTSKIRKPTSPATKVLCPTPRSHLKRSARLAVISTSSLCASVTRPLRERKRKFIDIHEEIIKAPDTRGCKKSPLPLSASSAVRIDEGEGIDIIIHPSNRSVAVTLVNPMDMNHNSDAKEAEATKECRQSEITHATKRAKFTDTRSVNSATDQDAWQPDRIVAMGSDCKQSVQSDQA